MEQAGCKTCGTHATTASAKCQLSVVAILHYITFLLHYYKREIEREQRTERREQRAEIREWRRGRIFGAEASAMSQPCPPARGTCSH